MYVLIPCRIQTPCLLPFMVVAQFLVNVTPATVRRKEHGSNNAGAPPSLVCIETNQIVSPQLSHNTIHGKGCPVVTGELSRGCEKGLPRTLSVLCCAVPLTVSPKRKCSQYPRKCEGELCFPECYICCLKCPSTNIGLSSPAF